ncbi:gamma carbonic anhydrase family protein [Candidatus Altiarchaeota archaeon]
MMIDNTVFIAAGAQVVGMVYIDEYSSVWYNAVVRGDRSKITIGRFSNIQDGCIIHGSEDYPVRIGDFVSVGHGSKIHGAEVSDNCIIGMGAILLNGVRIGKDSVVAAGSVVTEAKKFPDRSLIMGTPATVVRSLHPEEVESIKQNALEYKDLTVKHKSGK